MLLGRIAINMRQFSSKQDVLKIILFDTNFVRRLLNDGFQEGLNDPGSELRESLQPPFTPWRTPFSFMELIGINSKKLPTPTEFDPSTVTDGDFLSAAFKHHRAHYDSLSILDQNSLHFFAEKQRVRVASHITALWDAMNAGIFSDRDVSAWLRFALAFDAVQKLNVSSVYRTDYWSHLVSNVMFNADHRVTNLSKFRLAFRMWIRTCERLSCSTIPEESRRVINESHKLLKIGNWDDYLDVDLVHIATLGVKPDGCPRAKAICLTCDNPKSTALRVQLYKGFLSYVRKRYTPAADALGYSPDYELKHNGEVICFDMSGRFVERIDVSQCSPLPFLGHPTGQL